jgi:tape measure domain-containing protein
MATVDDKVVSMSFESTKFTTGVSETLKSLDKLNAGLKNVGNNAASGFSDIEKDANKVHLTGISGALDKLKSKFGFPEAAQGFSEVEKEAGKVGLTGISGALDKLKSKFGFGREAEEGFSQIEKASGKVTFSGLSNALDGIATKFSTLQAAASVALGNIATRAVSAGTQIAKSFSFDLVKGGLEEYENQLNSVQTILANTQASGATLKDVNKSLNELNHYADKTIYNFGQMTKNIGTFTAAGVDLKTSTQAIKGIANLAALSGSNAEQASTAMYQLSQAISSGKVGLQDWNSVVNAGMGGTVFQRALAQTAEKMGTLSDGAVQLKGKMKNVTIEGQSFRESIQAKPGEKSWLTSDVLTSTLKQFTGDMTDAQLKAEGFNEAQIKAIQLQSKTALNAATQVKTLSGVLDTAKEAAGSGWAQTWQIVFGDFGEAKTLFTGLSNAINGFIGDSANARNKVLEDWKALGGRKDLIEGIKNAFEALRSIVKPVKDAFREIFPPKTGQDLADLTKKFRDFTENLKIGPETAENLKNSFKGLFALLDIGKQIIGGIFTAIAHMFGAMSDGSGGFLKFTGNIGTLLVALDDWLKKGDKLKSFFGGLGDVLSIPITMIKKLTGALAGLFGGDDNTSKLESGFKGMGDALKPASSALDAATTAWSKFIDVLKKVGDLMKPVVRAIGEAFGDVGKTIADALSNQNFDHVFAVLQTGLIAGIFLTIKKALGGGLEVDIGGGILKNLSESFDVLNGSLKAMQNNIKANTLFQIAGAVALLAAAVVALSFVDPKRLASSMAAISVGFGQLMGAMAMLTKIGGSAGFVKMPVIAASLILLAAAIDVLAIAMVSLSKLSWEEIGKGLAGVAGMLILVSAAVQPLSSASVKMLPAAVGLIALGVALNILALAVKVFATMSWEQIGKGLAGVAGALIAVGLAANLLPPSMILTGPALIAMAVGLSALGAAVKIFGSMDMKTMGKGLLGIGAALVVIGLAMGLMPPTLPITAAGLILVGIGLVGVSKAIKTMGAMDIGSLAKGIGALAATLIVLAAGLTAMIVSLPGAAALMVAAAALAVLVPVLGVLGNMSWGTITKGLAAIALSLVAISVAGAVAAPGLILLGAALVVFGAGVALAGGGVFLLAKGLVLLGSDGAKGIAVLVAALTTLVGVLPNMIINFIKGLVQIVAEIAKLAPLVVDSLVKIMNALLDVIIKSAPKIGAAATAIITAIITTLTANAPQIIKAGWELLQAFLKGIDDHIGQVVTQVTDIVVKFLNAVASNIPRITAAGLNVLIQFIAGIGNNLSRVVTAGTSIIINLAQGIADNVQRIVTAGANIISQFITGIGTTIDNIISRGAAMINRIIEGIGNNVGKLVEEGTRVATKFISGLAGAAVDLAEAGGNAVLKILSGIHKWLDDNASKIGAEGRGIATSLMSGIASGALGVDIGALGNAIINKVKAQLNRVKKFFHIKSPSRVAAEEIGLPIAEGVAVGISEGESAIEDAGDSMLTTLKATLSNIPDMVDMDMSPVITPVLDLTQIQKDAQQLTDLSNVVPISAAASFDAAASIDVPQPGTPEAGEAAAGSVFKFEQNNYSPESLSDAEIYRQTNNQLSQAKTALGL